MALHAGLSQHHLSPGSYTTLAWDKVSITDFDVRVPAAQTASSVLKACSHPFCGRWYRALGLP